MSWKGRRDRHFPQPGGQYRRTSPANVVHRPGAMEKPWKRQGAARANTQFPQLWREVWRSSFLLQIGALLREGVGGKGPLARRIHSGIVGHSKLRAEASETLGA